jgi:hypothetical protein
MNIEKMLRNADKHFWHCYSGYKPSDDVKKCQQAFLVALPGKARG